MLECWHRNLSGALSDLLPNAPPPSPSFNKKYYNTLFLQSQHDPGGLACPTPPNLILLEMILFLENHLKQKEALNSLSYTCTGRIIVISLEIFSPFLEILLYKHGFRSFFSKLFHMSRSRLQ